MNQNEDNFNNKLNIIKHTTLNNGYSTEIIQKHLRKQTIKELFSQFYKSEFIFEKTRYRSRIKNQQYLG